MKTSPLLWAAVLLLGVSLVLRDAPLVVQAVLTVAQLVLLGLWLRQVYSRRAS